MLNKQKAKRYRQTINLQIAIFLLILHEIKNIRRMSL